MSITLDDFYENYILNLGLLEKRISDLEEALNAKNKKERKKKINETISLNDVKLDFIDGKPELRDDPFKDTELAMWASYLLSKTDRKELITSWPELHKRGKLARKIVDFFIEKYENEEQARYLAKDYLEMVLTQYPTFKGKDGEQNMNFFTATSDFAIGYYSQRMTNWKQVKNLPDESLD